jgi:hypothetical protein
MKRHGPLLREGNILKGKVIHINGDTVIVMLAEVGRKGLVSEFNG